MGTFNVGLGKLDYTPEIGLPLMGNFRDDYASRGVHDPLGSHAIVIEGDGGDKLAMLSIDICMFRRRHTALMREYISSKCDVPGENILIAGTHTHSAPSVCEFGALPQCDPGVSEVFLKKAAEAVVVAAKNLKPATLRVGRSKEARVSFNRRLKCKDGQTHMNWEGLDPDFVIAPLGPTDPQLITIAIEYNGDCEGVLVNFALHPAILAGDNWLYSGDYPNYLREGLNRLGGRDLMTAFFNGPCGNVNHIDYSDLTQGRGYQMTQRVGYMLAVAADEAMRSAVEVQGDTIAVSRELVSLPRVKISDEKLAWAKDVLEQAKDNSAGGQVDGLPDEHYAKTYLTMYEVQDTDDQVEVMVLRIGDVGIVGFPGEMFCEFGLEVKEKSPGGHTLVIELANDAVGYLPTREAFKQGGYEPSTGSTRYEPGAGEKLTASALKQLNKLFTY